MSKNVTTIKIMLGNLVTKTENLLDIIKNTQHYLDDLLKELSEKQTKLIEKQAKTVKNSRK